MSIGLIGDVMLGRGVGAVLAERPDAVVWGDDLRALASSLDLVVANLECCLSARGHRTERIAGKPFFFRGPPHATEQLRALGIRAVGLANNHALDYEEEALSDTLDVLAEAQIASAGAGRDLAGARRSAVVSAGRARVGLITVSDHPAEYAAAGERPGIAHADLRRELPPWLGEELASRRRDCDVVIAFPHWGPNMVVTPAPWQLRRAEELQAAGADLVAGHSAHVFHGVSWTSRGPILTDLGDALDDYRVEAELRNDLGLLAVWRPGAGEQELELVGLRLRHAFTDLARDADAQWIARRLRLASGRLRIECVGEQRFRVVRS
ncbi:MAG: CapA family protein [Actinomycetota bacterium]|nr:CapA family protein [Actinomycetota bacterium]